MQHTYRRHKVTHETRADGTLILRSAYPASEPVSTTLSWLHKWAEETPQAVFLAERSGPGWREMPYGETLARVRRLAGALVSRGMGPDTPILILSGNGVDHGLLTLAAHYVGVPTVPVAEQYSLVPGADRHLRYIAGLIRPTMVYAADGAAFARGLALDELADCEQVVSTQAGPGMTPIDTLLASDETGVDAALSAVNPDTVTKILMTSGSTANPKGVITTQRMLCANQQQYIDALPFLQTRPPRLVDWLPWNHVFGGSNNFNMMLAHGGALYIDAGKPAKALIGKTVENNLLMNATIAYNVPAGFALLRDAMRTDAALRTRFFSDLDMIFYAGAALPQDVWRDLSAMARDVRGDPPMMTTCWGLTETAPACIFQHEPTDVSGRVGVPMTGVTVKLVPEADGRYDVRVKGPNITPGYVNDPAKTAEAFDDEGYFISGDAMRLVDPEDLSQGLAFDGRIVEDFKLSSGTWVRATGLRLDLLEALAPLAADVILTGADRDAVGLMILLTPDTIDTTADLEPSDGAFRSPSLQAEIAQRVQRLCAGRGASGRVTRFMILAEPASMADGEITAKGNLNFRRLLDRRAAMVARLYTGTDPDVTTF